MTTSKNIDDLFNQARRHEQEGNLNGAISICQKIIELKPDNLPVYFCFLGSLFAQNDELYKASDYLNLAIRKNKRFADAYYLLGNVELVLGNAEFALDCFRRARQHGYQDKTKILIGITNVYERLGKKEKVIDITSREIESGNRNIIILVNHALCSNNDHRIKAIELLKIAIENDKLTGDEQRNGYFALGKLYDKTKNYRKAFEFYQKANKAKNTRFDQLNDNRSTEILINTFNPDFLKNILKSKKKSKSVTPAFIVGFPRSGTSLLEKILDSHPQVYGAGELPDVMDIAKEIASQHTSHTPYPQCLLSLTQKAINKYSKTYLSRLEILASGTPRYVIDKSPANYINLGLIQILFPNARVLHCTRNPVDTCLSCYFQDFSSPQPHTYNLDDLSSTYKNYWGLISHWKQVLNLKIMDVNYEDLIGSTKATIEKVLTFLNLKWDERCMRFYMNKRITKTASYDQTNQKIYKSSIERWKNYSDLITDNENLMALLDLKN